MERQEGERLASVQERGEESRILSGRDIAAAKSKAKEHPQGRKVNPALGSLGKTFPGKLFLLGMCRGKAGPAVGNRELQLLLPKKGVFWDEFGVAAPPWLAIPAFLSWEEALPLLGMWEMRVGCGEIGIFQVWERWESFPG